MKGFYLILFILLPFLISCSIGQPISKGAPYNNESYQVEYLFEHDGCKVYRFYDRGNYVYFTNCRSDVTAISTDSTETVIQNFVRIE